MTDKKDQIVTAINKLFKNQNKGYIFIYAPPKVGSTTLVTTFRVFLSEIYNVIHIHDEVMLNVLTGIKDITINDIINYLGRLGEKIFVFDVYRTPVERKMSEYFDDLSAYHFNNTEENLASYSTDRIIQRFNNIYPHIGKGDHYREKYNLTGDFVFNFDKKYLIREVNSIKYIKLRLCDQHLWSDILTEIMGREVIMIKENSMENKTLGELYKKVKESYLLPLNYYEELEKDDGLKRYYTEIERMEYLRYWNVKMTEQRHIGYTHTEYKLYVTICLENQSKSSIRKCHYIDNGCQCVVCNGKRLKIKDFVNKGSGSGSGSGISNRIEHDVMIKRSVKRLPINKPRVGKWSQSLSSFWLHNGGNYVSNLRQNWQKIGK
jgi:hypothetical protein